MDSAPQKEIKTRTKQKARLQGYRVLAMLLYGQTGFLLQLEPLKVAVRIGAAARYFQTSNGKVIEQLRWLQTMGIVQEVTADKKTAVVTLVKPLDRPLVQA